MFYIIMLLKYKFCLFYLTNLCFSEVPFINLASGKLSKVEKKKKLPLVFLYHIMKRNLFTVVNSLCKVYSNAEQFCPLINIFRTKGESSTLC
jgi:hypothetical protein